MKSQIRYTIPFSFLFVVFAANAQLSLPVPLPVADGLGYGALMIQTAKDAGYYAKDLATKKADMVLQDALNKNLMNNDQNIAAESVARLTDNQTALYNKKLMQDSAPALNACAAYKTSTTAKSAETASRANIALADAAAIKRELNTNSGFKSHSALRQSEAKKYAERFDSNLKSGNPGLQASTENFLRFNKSTNATQAELTAQGDFIALAVGPYPSSIVSNDINLETDAQKFPDIVVEKLKNMNHKDAFTYALEYLSLIHI